MTHAPFGKHYVVVATVDGDFSTMIATSYEARFEYAVSAIRVCCHTSVIKTPASRDSGGLHPCGVHHEGDCWRSVNLLQIGPSSVLVDMQPRLLEGFDHFRGCQSA